MTASTWCPSKVTSANQKVPFLRWTDVRSLSGGFTYSIRLEEGDLVWDSHRWNLVAWRCFNNSSLFTAPKSRAEPWSDESNRAVSSKAWEGGSGANMNHAQCGAAGELMWVCRLLLLPAVGGRKPTEPSMPKQSADVDVEPDCTWLSYLHKSVRWNDRMLFSARLVYLLC